MIELRYLTPDDWAAWRELRLAALADAPAAFAATLADWQGERDLEHRWRGRLSDVPLNVLADVAGRPAGMVSAMPDGDTVELLSMWVAPFARGRGVGDALVRAVLDWAASRANTVRLQVAEDNGPAIALYARHGFTDVGAPELSARDGLVERVMVTAWR